MINKNNNQDNQSGPSFGLMLLLLPFAVIIFAYIFSLLALGGFGLGANSCEIDSWMNVSYQRFYDRARQAFAQSNSKEPKIFDGFVEPLMPDNELNDATLLGVDSNHDGIRDDVEIWINRNFENKNLRLIFKQMARNEIYAMYMTARGNENAMISSYAYRYALWECSLDFGSFRSDDYKKYDVINNLSSKLDKYLWGVTSDRAQFYKSRCDLGTKKADTGSTAESWKKCYSYIPGLEGKPYED